MANRPCDSRIVCPGQDNPLGNYSYEQPDPFSYLAWEYPITNPHNPIGGPGPNNPPVYFASDCAGLCVSFISQEDANLCAARQAFICSHTPPGGTPPTLFFNTLQTCFLNCGGGSVFIWQTLPGSFVALSQAAADDQAQAYACEQAALHAFCLNDIPNEAETGTEYDATIFANGAARTPVQFSVLSGSLPPGLHLTPEGPLSTFLHGTPTTAGTYTFTIIARDALNVFVTKTYTITVTSTCSAFWTSVAANWTIQTFAPNSFASVAGTLVTVSAYTRNGLDLSGIAEADNGLFVGNPVQTTQFQCTLTVVPIAITNIGPVGQISITVDDFATAAVYLSFTGLPGAPIVLNFTLPVGSRPRVGIQAAVQTPNNGFDSQVAYGVTLG